MQGSNGRAGISGIAHRHPVPAKRRRRRRRRCRRTGSAMDRLDILLCMLLMVSVTCTMADYRGAYIIWG